jgi:hypothetical protein
VSTTGIVIACVISALYVAAIALWCRSRFARLAARRDEIGDVEIPPRRLLRAIVTGGIVIVAGTLVPLVLRTDVGLLVSVTLVAGGLWLVLWMTVRDGEAAQRRAAQR